MTKRPVNSRVKHGDPACADYGCKREECLDARRFKQKRNKLLRSTGRPGMVPPDRVAAHIARFRAAGLQDKDIIGELAMARNTFYRVLRGLPLSRAVEQRALSVRPPAAVQEVATLASVPAVGTQRRLQALAHQGWPSGVLEERLGYHQGWITRSSRRATVTMVTRQRVAALYDELWNVAPEAAGVDRGRVRAARETAIGRGFHGPLAWDDETIDDPAARPDVVRPVPLFADCEGPQHIDRVAVDAYLAGRRVDVSDAERLAALLAVPGRGMSLLEVDRLRGLPDKTSEVFLRRMTKRYERAGLALPDAGAEILVLPPMKRAAARMQNEMGEAA